MEFFETINKYTVAYKKERILTPKSSMQCKTKYYICRTQKRRSLNPKVVLRRYQRDRDFMLYVNVLLENFVDTMS